MGVFLRNFISSIHKPELFSSLTKVITKQTPKSFNYFSFKEIQKEVHFF